MRFILCLVLPLFLSWSVSAQSTYRVAGQDDPAFVAAIDLWLAGEDAVALPAFAALAREDNRAAQVFLGQIGQLIYLHSHVTGDMGRRDRIALLRSPGGLSGTSWLRVAAEDELLAQALVDRRGAETVVQGTAEVLDLGETREGFMGLMNQSLAGSDLFENLPAFLALTAHPTIMAEARWIGLRMFQSMRWEVENFETPSFDVDRFWEAAALLDATGPFPSDIVENWVNVQMRGPFAPEAGTEDYLAQGAFMAAEPLFASIRGVCETTCPGAIDACMFTINWRLAGSLYVYGYSPAEWAVPTQTYRAASRFHADVLRAASVGPDGIYLTRDGREISLCQISLRSD